MKEITGIFDAADAEVFTKYRVNATFTHWVMGGIPQKPEIIEAWLRKRVMGGDDELRTMLLKTLDDLNYDIPAEATHEEILEAIKTVAAQRNGNTFRRNGHGLFLNDYQVKAMLKEATNILYAGERWGVTKKGPKSYLAERVFVDELQIPMGRNDPDGTHLQIGQVNGPKGPRSTLTYVDYCEQPDITFTVSSLHDCIDRDKWTELLVLSQRLGMGALRSLGYGTFKVTGFDKV